VLTWTDEKCKQKQLAGASNKNLLRLVYTDGITLYHTRFLQNLKRHSDRTSLVGGYLDQNKGWSWGPPRLRGNTPGVSQRLPIPTRYKATSASQTAHTSPPPCLPDYNCSPEQRGSSLNRPTSPSRPSYTPSCTSSSARHPSYPPSQTPREPTATASAAVAVPVQARARRPEEVTRVRRRMERCRSASMVVRRLRLWFLAREER
jgi:hypothetical protein